MKKKTEIAIVMYHYVRDTAKTSFPDIKALSIESFNEQLDYLQKRYEFIRMEDLLSFALDSKTEIPRRAALLTFDDGYVDHYKHVFPILADRGLFGAFFPSAQSAVENTVLDVNKLHFLLASGADVSDLISVISNSVDLKKTNFSLREFDAYWHEYAVVTKFAPASVNFVKRMLQFALPESLRTDLLDELFSKFVTSDFTGFAQELYVSSSQWKELVNYGMYIGNHGNSHAWMDQQSDAEQCNEITKALRFLNSIGMDTQHWCFCYPFGIYNQSLIQNAKNLGCILGLTTKFDFTNLDRDDLLLLPRIDTVDLPPVGNLFARNAGKALSI